MRRRSVRRYCDVRRCSSSTSGYGRCHPACDRGVVCGRPRRRRRLRGARTGFDRIAVPGVSVRGAGHAHVPHRRSWCGGAVRRAVALPRVAPTSRSKSAGYRIEPGEVRGRAGRAGRRRAGRGDCPTGPPRRSAVWWGMSPGPSEPAAVRAALLAERLPGVHGARPPWSALAALPLTVNGKLDKQALPDTGNTKTPTRYRGSRHADRGDPGRSSSRRCSAWSWSACRRLVLRSGWGFPVWRCALIAAVNSGVGRLDLGGARPCSRRPRWPNWRSRARCG